MSTIGINNGNWRAGIYAEFRHSIVTPMADREKALEQIKQNLGSEAFERWYHAVYQLRKEGKQVEYENKIFGMQMTLKNIIDNIESSKHWIETETVSYRKEWAISNLAYFENQLAELLR